MQSARRLKKSEQSSSQTLDLTMLWKTLSCSTTQTSKKEYLSNYWEDLKACQRRICKMAEDIKGLYDISGMGGGYEEACQKMLQAGYDWLVDRREKARMEKGTSLNLQTSGFKGVYGIIEPESEDAKELSKAVTDAVDDCTGAMHQAVMGHLFYINKHGIEAWKKEVSKDE